MNKFLANEVKRKKAYFVFKSEKGPKLHQDLVTIVSCKYKYV